MFMSVEHALMVSFTIAGYPIEPKNATQSIVEALEERFGQRAPRLPSGLSPHDWHAQSVMTLQLTRRALDHGPLWTVVQAEYDGGLSGARAVQAVADMIRPEVLAGRDRLLTDALTMRVFRGRPRMRDLADSFDLSTGRLTRMQREMSEKVAPWRTQAIGRLHPAMEKAGLLQQETA